MATGAHSPLRDTHCRAAGRGRRPLCGRAPQKQMGWMAPAPGVAAPKWCCHAARAWTHHDGDHDVGLDLAKNVFRNPPLKERPVSMAPALQGICEGLARWSGALLCPGCLRGMNRWTSTNDPLAIYEQALRYATLAVGSRTNELNGAMYSRSNRGHDMGSPGLISGERRQVTALF